MLVFNKIKIFQKYTFSFSESIILMIEDYSYYVNSLQITSGQISKYDITFLFKKFINSYTSHE